MANTTRLWSTAKYDFKVALGMFSRKELESSLNSDILNRHLKLSRATNDPR
jgi:hypothetical protein